MKKEINPKCKHKNTKKCVSMDMEIMPFPSVEMKSKQIITYKCLDCGEELKNKQQDEDDYNYYLQQTAPYL